VVLFPDPTRQETRPVAQEMEIVVIVGQSSFFQANAGTQQKQVEE
jgi:hypothetical protein